MCIYVCVCVCVCVWVCVCVCVCVCVIGIVDIDMVARVFASGPGDQGSIPSRVIQRLNKWYLMPQRYKVQIMGKVDQFRERSSPLSTPWCSSD